MTEVRSQWGSKIGFVLAASGSAIGLGNVVFFSANAYRYGSGAFYIPYLVALFAVGLPVMLMELALGSHVGKAFPQSLHAVAGRRAEFIGWWAVLNAAIISMYYVTILGWVIGMLVGSLGALWNSAPVTNGAFAALGLANPFGYFFRMLGSWQTILFVAFVWACNWLAVSRGAQSIETTSRWALPMMWLCMIALIVRGLTLPNGEHGVYLLFNPNFRVMADPEVWKGAFSQMFFTLSLGFGIMTAYASYLPRRTDQVHNTATVCFLNCSFEFIAGLAIFSLLFTFSVIPKASTLSMMFFVVPQGIANLPGFVIQFGVIFFFLLFIAGLTSSISLVEALVAALIDKFRWPRRWVLAAVILGCFAGSVAFALPHVVDRNLASNGTLGLTLLDLFDHWAFSYGLLVVGLAECIIVGWVFGARRLREIINEHATLAIGAGWEAVIRIVVPAILIVILVSSIVLEVTGGIYGSAFVVEGIRGLPWISLALWLAFTTGGAAILTWGKDYRSEDNVRHVQWSGEAKR